jgi:hypothetical protein
MTSAPAPILSAMFRALVTCPDDDCAEAFDAVAELEQLESLICDCGCTLHVERLCEHEGELPRDQAFELVALH